MATHDCQTPAELAAALLHILPGDIARVLPGQYDGWAIELNRSGKPGAPVILDLTGVRFSGASRILLRGDHNLIVGGAFEGCGSSGTAVVTNAPQACFNEFRLMTFRGSRGTSIKFVAAADLVPTDGLVVDCQFRDIPETTGETLQLGQGPGGARSARIRVRSNLFVNCRAGAEIVSVKLSDCELSGNVAKSCPGRFSLRGGNGNIARRNTAIDCQGVVGVNGRGCVVEDNAGVRCTQFGIALMAKYGSRAGCYDSTIRNNVMVDCAQPLQIARRDDPSQPIIDIPRGNLIEGNAAFPESWAITAAGLDAGVTLADVLAANTVIPV